MSYEDNTYIPNQKPIEASTAHSNDVFVTVITPAHNSGEWLDETIRSVREQTEDNLRYLIINDSSSDNSGEIAYDHAASDERIQVYDVAFGSVALSRQVGVEAAKTPFVSFLDGDDRWHSTFLKKAKQTFEQQGPNLLATYCQMGLIDSNSNHIDNPDDPTKGEPKLSVTGPVDFDHYLLYDTPARSASSVVMRTAALQKNAFRQEAEPCEDYDLWAHVLNDNPDGIFYGIPERLFDYRIRKNQLTSDTSLLFAGIDRLFAKFVPLMRDPAVRWEVYQSAVRGAMVRGCPQFVQHFSKIAGQLAVDPGFRPSTLDG